MKSVIASLAGFAAVAIVTLQPSSADAVQPYYYHQDEISLGVAPDIAFPLGSFSDVANAGLGINGNVEYRVNSNWDVLFNVGYIHWDGKSKLTGFDYSYSAVPFQGGAKYYFKTSSLDAPHFYVGGLMGFHDMSLRVPVVNDEGIVFDRTSSETEFSLAPLGGMEYGLSNNVLLDVSARYQYVANDFSYFGLRAGLNFRIR